MVRQRVRPRFEQAPCARQRFDMIHHEGTKSTKDTKARAMVLSHAVVGAAIEVHRYLGPGLLSRSTKRPCPASFGYVA